MSGSRIIQFIFDVFNMLTEFTATMQVIMTMSLSEIFGYTIGLEVDQTSDNILYKGIQQFIIDALNGISNVTMLEMFTGTSLIVIMGLLLLKRFAPVA